MENSGSAIVVFLYPVEPPRNKPLPVGADRNGETRGLTRISRTSRVRDGGSYRRKGVERQGEGLGGGCGGGARGQADRMAGKPMFSSAPRTMERFYYYIHWVVWISSRDARRGGWQQLATSWQPTGSALAAAGQRMGRAGQRGRQRLAADWHQIGNKWQHDRDGALLIGRRLPQTRKGESVGM